jgi:hypothetical protein
LDGLSIVNGAQTTRTIGNADSPPAEDAHVLARFIAVDDPALVQSIIKFNNSQNRVEAADFRSADEIQTRLREEFAKYYSGLRYLGGRRGGNSDEIRRNRKSAQLLDSTEVAESLAAFHGMATTAYNRVKDLWGDENYQRIFPREQITARHIVYVYSLYRAIAEYKASIRAKPESERTSSEKEQLALLNSTSAYFVLMAGIGKAIEMLAGRAIPSTYQLGFGLTSDMDVLVKYWSGPVSLSMPFLRKFKGVIDDGLKSESEVTTALEEFASSLEALSDTLECKLKEFRVQSDLNDHLI